MIRVALEQTFTAPVDAVQAAFLDAGVLALRAELPNVRLRLLGCEREGATVRQRIHYTFTGELPPAARAVVDPALLTWVEEQEHDTATRRARLRIVPDHYAHRFSCLGSVALYEAWGAVRRATEASLRVDVPLVGGRVERAILTGLRAHAAAEAEIVQAWLDG